MDKIHLSLLSWQILLMQPNWGKALHQSLTWHANYSAQTIQSPPTEQPWYLSTSASPSVPFHWVGIPMVSFNQAPHSVWTMSGYCSCSVAKSCLTLCNPMNHSTPVFPVLHYLPEFAQIHVHWVGDSIQPSHPLSSPSLPDFNLSQHQGLFKWVSSSNQMTSVLEFQLQHQSFQWIFRTDFF